MRRFWLGHIWMICSVLALALPGARAAAQEGVFVQIESHGALGTTEQRARAYAQIVDDVTAFRASTGLYAVALGPYAPADAQAVLRDLRARGLIPGDSFITEGGIYLSQVFPIGGDALTAAPASTPESASAPAAVAAQPAPALPEETPAEARRSEAQLDRPAREAIQIALEWFGFYTAGIDGAFGPGTRRGMESWQIARGFAPTGVLTTRQRAQLLDEYRGELAALGMQTVQDTRAGVEIDLPLAMVAFDSYNFPFAQYAPLDDSGVQVLLISQPGDRNTLFGLYEIMQTLEIVPLEGERTRDRDGFLLTGQSDDLRSHTEARLVGGAVKGFTLVWPPERDAQMDRVLPMMQSSFRAIDGVLDPSAVPDGMTTDIDLVSGLEVRRPEIVRTGFFLDAAGTVMTTTEIAGQCAELLIDDIYPATVAYRDDALGVALLRPDQALAPLAFAEIGTGPGRLRADVAVAGFPFGGTLSSASMTFGSLADIRGMNGEDTVQRLVLATADSEAGGPVFDLSGTVLGMVLPGGMENRALPEDVTLALRVDRLGPLFEAAGVSPQPSTRQGALNRENLARLGADMTVTVSCWN
jgi:peptidoglycan hydrolase-like protein with peptidoglycan-binding domain